MAMNVQKLSPWNWFRKEEMPAHTGIPSGNLPVARGGDPVTQFHNEVERLFDSFFRGSGWSLPHGLSGDWTGSPIGAASMLRPQLDIAESSQAYTVTVDVPGVELDDLNVSVQDDTLTISGEKRRETREEDGEFHRMERGYGQFRRVLALPEDADGDKIHADFRNGVLTITVPRREGLQASRGRTIPIGNGK